MERFNRSFPRYELYPTEVPVWCLTPDDPGEVIHRFFDTSPLSPSGRYVAALRIPVTDRAPLPGEPATVLLIDTETGCTKEVAETRGWELQLGANLNWGRSDEELIFNDVDTSDWSAYAVVFNPITGTSRKLDGTVYHVSPDGRSAVSSNLVTTRRMQNGYGVVIPDHLVPINRGPVDHDGIFVTDIASGERKLLISTREVVERAIPTERRKEYEKSEVYGFHSKWSPDGTRIMFSLRYFPYHGSMFNAMRYEMRLKFDIFTMKTDKTELYNTVPAEQWAKGGHHTTWTPDSRHLTMNLNIFQQGMRFCKCQLDGSDLAPVGEYVGSGHPTLHRNGRYVVTDCYIPEQFTRPDRSVPLRFFDLSDKSERALTYLEIYTPALSIDADYRLDPHPAWSNDYQLLFFNGMIHGKRKLFAADMRKFEE